MDAALDARAAETSSRYRRVVRKRRIFGRGSGQSGHFPLEERWRRRCVSPHSRLVAMISSCLCVAAIAMDAEG
jgi:hypothetical protein